MKKERKDIIRFQFVALVMLVFCYQPALMAQVQNYEDNEGSTRSQKFDTRSLSLGSATVADVFGRASIGVNPALSGLYEANIVYQLNSYHNWDTNMMQHDLTLPILAIGPHHFSTRFGFVHRGYNDTNPLGEAQMPVPDMMLYHADFAYAYAFSEVFSMGMLNSFSYVQNGTEFWTYFADIGLVYAPSENISYGMVLRGIGRESTYEVSDTDETILLRNDLKPSLELGSTFQFPSDEKPYLSVSLSNKKRFGERGLWYKAGAEVLPVPVIALRSGLLFHMEQAVYIPRFGLGFSPGTISIDYMFAPRNIRGEHFHQIGLTLQF